MSHERVSPAVVNRVTWIAGIVAVMLTVSIPLGHVIVGLDRERVVSAATAEKVALDVSAKVARNPRFWQYEAPRLLAVLANAKHNDAKAHIRVVDPEGAVLVDIGKQPAWPAMTETLPVYDAGLVVAHVVVARSLVPLLDEVLLSGFLALVLGLSAFYAFRLLPLRLLRRALADATHLAQHDALTGLPTRALLRDRVEKMLSTRRPEQHGALLIIDLDRFKPVNDLHGHGVGDQLLREVATRLRAAARAGDLVSRLGGDEFAIVADVSPEAAERLGRRIVNALGQPFTLGDTVVRIGCSVGIAICHPGRTDVDLLMTQADAALYRAKHDGRGAFRVFDPSMDGQLRERAALEAELRAAIAQDALVPYFQPLVDLDTGRLTGFEMLARWPHATRGLVSPAEFIPIAEDSGLIGPLTEKLLDRGCRAAVTWPENLALSVNLSPRQVFDRTLVDMIRRTLARTGLAAQRLDLELTESALVSDIAAAREVLTELKALGIRLSLDDFGTGYSSLAHLQALPFDKLKIDAGFVRAMTTDTDSRKIVAAVIGLGHSLGLPTVAEGIETDAQLATLREMGCDIGQGWLFGAAAPEANMATSVPVRGTRAIA